MRDQRMKNAKQIYVYLRSLLETQTRTQSFTMILIHQSEHVISDFIQSLGMNT